MVRWNVGDVEGFSPKGSERKPQGPQFKATDVFCNHPSSDRPAPIIFHSAKNRRDISLTTTVEKDLVVTAQKSIVEFKKYLHDIRPATNPMYISFLSWPTPLFSGPNLHVNRDLQWIRRSLILVATTFSVASTETLTEHSKIDSNKSQLGKHDWQT